MVDGVIHPRASSCISTAQLVIIRSSSARQLLAEFACGDRIQPAKNSGALLCPLDKPTYAARGLSMNTHVTSVATKGVPKRLLTGVLILDLEPALAAGAPPARITAR